MCSLLVSNNEHEDEYKNVKWNNYIKHVFVEEYDPVPGVQCTKHVRVYVSAQEGV